MSTDGARSEAKDGVARRRGIQLARARTDKFCGCQWRDGVPAFLRGAASGHGSARGLLDMSRSVPVEVNEECVLRYTHGARSGDEGCPIRFRVSAAKGLVFFLRTSLLLKSCDVHTYHQVFLSVSDRLKLFGSFQKGHFAILWPRLRDCNNVRFMGTALCRAISQTIEDFYVHNLDLGPHPRGLTALRTPGTDTMVICSLGVPQYHDVCCHSLPQYRSIFVSLPVTVNLTTVMSWPHGFEVDDVAEIPFIKTFPDSWQTSMVVGDELDSGWIRYPIETVHMCDGMTQRRGIARHDFKLRTQAVRASWH
ncbi:hypothetical protein C8R47DRAFT_431626 [Mycena vitilis]|nr:hypothetical protein C8R47DRAFT_431626 [Mycena vitilis]